MVKNTGHVDTAAEENNGDEEEINFVFWFRIRINQIHAQSMHVDTISIGTSSSSKHSLLCTVALQTQLGTFHTAFSMEHNSCEAHFFSELLLCRLNWAAPSLPQAGSMPSKG